MEYQNIISDIVTGFTFEQFVQHVKGNTPFPHWHYAIDTLIFSHENDKSWIVSTSEGQQYFEEGQAFIISIGHHVPIIILDEDVFKTMFTEFN